MASKLGNPGDTISTLLGAPPNSWKSSEVNQMKQIHKCFLQAQKVHRLSLSEEDFGETKEKKKKGLPFAHMAESSMIVTQVGQQETQFKDVIERQQKAAEAKADDEDTTPRNDTEYYLQQSSPLRTLNGEGKAPQNAIFKDHAAFQATCEFNYWKDFFNEGQDQILSQQASIIVSNICHAQCAGTIRVKKGVVPLRKKREHITPLALFFHEIKLWCVNWLRTADPFREETYLEIKHRMQYLDLALRKDVWGSANSRALVLGAGIHAQAHKEMIREQVLISDALKKSYEHALRQFNSQSSRDKLRTACENMRRTLTSHMQVVSGLLSLTTDVSKHDLRVMQMMLSLSNHGTVDYSNMINVLLYGFLQNTLVGEVLSSTYVGQKTDIGAKFSNWAEENLYCKPSDEDGEPYYQFMEVQGLMFIPAVYESTAADLTKGLKTHDPMRKDLPLKAKKHAKTLQTCFGFDKNEGTKPVERVMKLVMKSMAALQDMIPTLFLLDYFYDLAGTVGDYTLYDTLREYVIESMVKSVEKLQGLEQTTKQLVQQMTRIGQKHAELMKQEHQKKGKSMVSTPTWSKNVDHVRGGEFRIYKDNIKKTMKVLVSICHDAWYYDLTSDNISDKIENAKKTVNHIFQKGEEEAATEVVVDKTERTEKEFENHIKKNQKETWLKENTKVEDMEFGSANAFGEAEGGENFNFDADVPAKNNQYNYDSDNSSV